MTNRQQFLAGIKAQLPILLGTTPFGMITHCRHQGRTHSRPGDRYVDDRVRRSSQFVGRPCFHAHALGMVIVLTTFVVNLRHMLYSASVAPYVRHLSRPWKYALAFLLTDEAYAVSITNYRTASPEATQATNKHWFTLGAGLTLWVSWQISTIIGVALGASVPASWGLDFTLALTFIALLIPPWRTRPPSPLPWPPGSSPPPPTACRITWAAAGRAGRDRSRAGGGAAGRANPARPRRWRRGDD
jgi:predicted branched-subunit amino acid permease